MGTFKLPELRSLKRYRVGGRDTYAKANVVRETEEAFEEFETEDIAICINGHAIRGAQDLGGVCAVGGEILCKSCADMFRCELDNRSLCSAHTILHHGRKICSSHGFLEMVRFVLRR